MLNYHGDECIVAGPANTGKSVACLHKLHWAAQQYRGMRGLIVRKTRSSATEAALVTFETKILDSEWRTILVGDRQRENRHSYKYPNGSEIVVGGIDKATKIMSTEFDMIYIQEAIELTEADLESLSTRLRNGRMPYQQIIGDTNPDAATHWLKRRADAGLTFMPESRHEDNPRLWDADNGRWTEIGIRDLAKLERLTGVRYLRLRKGLWVGAEGLVYDEWDPAVHVIDAMPAGWHSWRKIRSIDFGYTNPFSCSWWAIDGDGRMYRYRQIYFTGRTVRVHARQIESLGAGESYEATVADHDAEDRATLDESGISTIAAHKAVKPGIEAFKERLKIAGDGKPRIFFLRDSRVEVDPDLIERKKPTCTEEEFGGYIWLPSVAGRAAREEPRKVDDHGLDEGRYAVAYVDGLDGRRDYQPARSGGHRPSLPGGHAQQPVRGYRR